MIAAVLLSCVALCPAPPLAAEPPAWVPRDDAGRVAFVGSTASGRAYLRSLFPAGHYLPKVIGP